VLQYGVYPVAQTAGYLFARHLGVKDSNRVASDFARLVSAGLYSGLTTAFFGMESELIDANAREAVSVEMGVDPKKLEFSDYKYSKNTIVSKAYEDIIRLQKYRYGTDMLFLLPTILRIGVNGANKAGFSKISWPEGKSLETNPDDHGKFDHLLNGHLGWNMSVYAGKAAYWAGETFMVPKTGNYEVVKLRENLQSTAKDITANDLFAVYQRTRSDKKLKIIENDSPDEHKAIWPLLQKMADAYNRHDGKFGISEIVYLIGLGKINIHAPDGETISEDAIKQSYIEIEKVETIGLQGIREENHRRRLMEGRGEKHEKSFVDGLVDGAFNTVQKILRNNPRDHVRKIKTEEYVTVRDPGELTNWNYSINR